MSNPFVTVCTFTYPHQLAVIRGRLQAEGIENIVQDEMTIQADPFYSNALGGIKLQVRESDMLQALEILEQAGYKTDDYAVGIGLGDLSTRAENYLAVLLSRRFFLYLVLIVSVLTAVAYYYLAT